MIAKVKAEYIRKRYIHQFSPIVMAINIHPK